MPRFNPPPNWPAPPAGWTPPEGWQPDPAWGPQPDGWQLWVDDAPAAYGLVAPIPPAPPAAPSYGVGAAVPAPASPAPNKRNWFVRHKALTAVIALVVIVGAAGAAGAAGGSKPSSKSSPTAAATSPAPTADLSSPIPVVTENTDPTPKDFTVLFKITQKDCFGSAGCDYVGHVQLGWADNLFTGDYDVTYKIYGVEGGPQIGTATAHDDGTYDYQTEDFQTTHAISKFKVLVTAVESAG